MIRPALALSLRAVLGLTATGTGIVVPLSHAAVLPMPARGYGVSPTIPVVRPGALSEPQRPVADQVTRAIIPVYHMGAYRMWGDRERGHSARGDQAGGMPAPPGPLRARAYQQLRPVGAVLTTRSPSGPVGGSIALTGTGFAHGEDVDLRLDGHAVGVLRTTGSGALPRGGGVLIPIYTTPGAHALAAAGRRSYARATASVRIYNMTVSTRHPVAGDVVLFQGRGYTPGQVMRFTFHQRGKATVALGLGGTDSSGALVPLRLYMPLAAAAGHVIIVAQDDAGERINLSLVIVAPSRR